MLKLRSYLFLNEKDHSRLISMLKLRSPKILLLNEKDHLSSCKIDKHLETVRSPKILLLNEKDHSSSCKINKHVETVRSPKILPIPKQIRSFKFLLYM